eukprot:CAMPEP_0119106260 /NCGR_PEP_ID=MMETSP1180-20130426/3998_1 /TAXON_ID=3052 ORGANISM="Chlamydomonas cf sp, Strain CCMP681" /NCGR_SAMPLE_ID=MMETSP1180 /ASSEMBLY_ACC=CAM_ASM_000741 /LENGTH=378 /DNA_ID=CAMNT_0007091551 /DNA_START=272 /DNA_END=1408 /DNA_ORIENTATION=+
MPLTHVESTVLLEPPFEGSEKRVEVDFTLGPGAPVNGLRSLAREQLDELMSLARCCIVSNRSNSNFDAYVLSESSLFVYPTKFVLKTCGTTLLLDSLPRLLEVAALTGLTAVRCKYTRASFLFPKHQPKLYHNFEDECSLLDNLFGHLQAGNGQQYVLGRPCEGLQWHVYVAGHVSAPMPTFNLELCMTKLGAKQCRQFFREGGFVSSAQTTEDTGIAKLLPGADMDDYVFEPCGYSMNGVIAHQFITIHVSPEESSSYASLEISGHMEDLPDCSNLLAQAVEIFRPGKISVAVSVDDASAAGAALWGDLSHPPVNYGYVGATCQMLSCGGRVMYYTLNAGSEEGLPKLQDQAGSISPKTVLHQSTSFLSNSALVGVA